MARAILARATLVSYGDAAQVLAPVCIGKGNPVPPGTDDGAASKTSLERSSIDIGPSTVVTIWLESIVQANLALLDDKGVRPSERSASLTISTYRDPTSTWGAASTRTV